jgi:hypothetical protein
LDCLCHDAIVNITGCNRKANQNLAKKKGTQKSAIPEPGVSHFLPKPQYLTAFEFKFQHLSYKFGRHFLSRFSAPRMEIIPVWCGNLMVSATRSLGSCFTEFSAGSPLTVTRSETKPAPCVLVLARDHDKDNLQGTPVEKGSVGWLERFLETEMRVFEEQQ